MYLCRFAWHWSNRHLFCGGQLLQRLVAGRAVAILGSCILSSILLIHPQVSRQWSVCVFVCVDVGVRGAPWGEAGQSLPVAALGQGMAIQDTCLGSQPNLTVASLTLCPIVPSHLLHVSLPSTLKYIDLPLTLLSPEFLPWFCFFAYPFLQFVYLPQRLSLPPSLSCCLSVFLCLCRSLSLPQYFGKVVFLH